MNDLSRRSFLGKSTLAAAGAVAVSSLMTGENGATGPTGAAATGVTVVGDREVLADPAGTATPVVLHIDDAGTGAVSAYVGHRHVVFTDRALVARVQGLNA